MTAVRRYALALSAMAGAACAAGPQLEAKPLSREQVLAFYAARGFDTAALAPYADACVISFSFRNEGSDVLRVRLADWRAGTQGRFTDRNAWESLWEKAGVAEPARIAFRWAQFPPEQEFAPGDWIMGMAALAARPAGTFRVTAPYSDEKGRHELVTEPIACAD